MSDHTEALQAGRQAADILEALPADEAHGYSPDEEAAQFSAVDRLVAAFRLIDQTLTHTPPVKRKQAKCRTCGDDVVFDAWVTADGEVYAVYDANFCVGCEGSVGYDYEEAEE